METQILDNDLQIITEEKETAWAGFWVRVAASLIDLLVFLPILGLNFYNIYAIKNLPLALLITMIYWVYKPTMEYLYGATLGKMAVKIKVVNVEFEKITLGQSLLRFTPWMIGQVISIISYILLFQNPNFMNAKSVQEVGTLQNEIISPLFNYVSSTIFLISCLFVAFHHKKKGLHDMIARTYCIYKK